MVSVRSMTMDGKIPKPRYFPYKPNKGNKWTWWRVTVINVSDIIIKQFAWHLQAGELITELGPDRITNIGWNWFARINLVVDLNVVECSSARTTTTTESDIVPSEKTWVVCSGGNYHDIYLFEGEISSYIWYLLSPYVYCVV